MLEQIKAVARSRPAYGAFAPSDFFFYGGPQMFACLIGYCNDIILCAFLQVVLSGLVWYI